MIAEANAEHSSLVARRLYPTPPPGSRVQSEPKPGSRHRVVAV